MSCVTINLTMITMTTQAIASHEEGDFATQFFFSSEGKSSKCNHGAQFCGLQNMLVTLYKVLQHSHACIDTQSNQNGNFPGRQTHRYPSLDPQGFLTCCGSWNLLLLLLDARLTSSWTRSSSQSRNSRASCCELPRNWLPYLETMVWRGRGKVVVEEEEEM